MKRISLYEWSMMAMALIVVAITMIQLTNPLPTHIQEIFFVIDTLIWLFFLVDYVVRLSLSKQKWEFIMSNKLDVLTIIPLYSMFRVLRLFRVAEVVKVARFAKVLRATVMLSTFSKKLGTFIRLNNFNYVLIGTLVIMLLGAGGIMLTENINFGDALWWSIVTIATVGYGDIAPTTVWGRIIAGIIMLAGIGFLGVLTGTISSYFLSKREKKISYAGRIIEDILDKLEDFDEVSLDDLKQMTTVLIIIKKGQIEAENRTREAQDISLYEKN
ncbi:MAG TPA: Ion channel protein [Firmicutes bacterium]|nr:Ion channel protein [Bacillota bacterium]